MIQEVSRPPQLAEGFTAVVQKADGWWIGWIEEIRGVNSQGRTKKELIENLRSALTEMIERNREDALAEASEGYEEIRIAV